MFTFSFYWYSYDDTCIRGLRVHITKLSLFDHSSDKLIKKRDNLIYYLSNSDLKKLFPNLLIWIRQGKWNLYNVVSIVKSCDKLSLER